MSSDESGSAELSGGVKRKRNVNMWKVNQRKIAR